MNLEIAKIQAYLLMAEHGLTQQGWTVEFHSIRCAAQCDHARKVISLLREYVELNEWEPHVKNSVIHEISHYFCPPIWGGRQWKVHHNLWRRKFIALGGTGERCLSKEAIYPERKEQK